MSVVIPTHDRAERVVAAMRSVAAQTWPNWELIVVDDASSDATPDVLAAAASGDPRLRVVRHDQARGGSAARNTGIDAAGGEYLAFLDDDDEWLPTKLAEQMAYLDAHPSVGAVSCWQVIDDGAATPMPFRGPTDITFADLCWDNFCGSASFCLLRRTAFTVEPRFDTALPAAQDWDVWLQCARGAAVAVVPEVLCRYAAHGDDRITGSRDKRVTGRQAIVARYGGSMTTECRAYHEASIALIGVDAPASEAKVLAGLLTHGHAAAAWALTTAAIAGRLGDRAGDPGRGARRLHRVIAGKRRAA